MSLSASTVDELPVPNVTYDKYARPSARFEGSDNASLESEPLHELAILREHGKWAMSLITRYLNKQYEQNYTGAQIVRIYRQLRYEQEEATSVHAGQVLVVWRENFRDAEPGSSEEQLFKELKDYTFQRFFETMQSELDDSDFEIDLELDKMAKDDVKFGSEIAGEDYTNRARAKWTAEETKLFSHDDGPHFLQHSNQGKDTDQNAAEGSERAAKKKAYWDDLRVWKEAAYKGETGVRMPLSTDAKYKTAKTLPEPKRNPYPPPHLRG